MKESTEQVLKEALKELDKLEDALGVGSSKIGITKKDKSQSKKARYQSKASRKINRSKKRHHWTAKEKKARK